jgi:hypothetical protein
MHNSGTAIEARELTGIADLKERFGDAASS